MPSTLDFLYSHILHNIFFINFSSLPIIPVFYISLLIICIGGKSAFYIKKFIEHRKDQKQIGPIIVTKIKVNNQRWNKDLCGVAGYLLILLTIFFINFTYVILSNIIYKVGFNEEQKLQLMASLDMLITKVFVPMGIYANNEKLRKHVKAELINR